MGMLAVHRTRNGESPPTTVTAVENMRLLCAFHWCYFTLLLIGTVLPPVINSNSCGVTFVLVGSTGSLARLYLWPALFKWYSSLDTQQSPCELIVFGASRKPFTDEERTWEDITSNLNCDNSTEQICKEAIASFRKAVHFIQIRSYDHYEKLQRQLQELYSSKNLKEVGRVFYLSIPPSGYQEVVQNIHEYLRPKPGTWLRVVLEKPFGNDLASAKLLASEMSKFLRDEEIYRIDHYLGKFGVEQILPFRVQNNDLLSPLWNKDAVQLIEVAMKERVDVKGRSKFYDSYGVIRDVLQNHLTEILVRLLVPTQFHHSEQFTKAKKRLLFKLYPPMLRHSLLGQYRDYHRHLEEDGVDEEFVDGNFSKSLTPTFASVALYLRDPQWNGVPFILISGKQLDKRAAYARIVFKQRQFHFGTSSENPPSCPPEIIFLIQDEQFPTPGLLISEQLLLLDLLPPISMDSVSWSRDVTTYPKEGNGNCKYTYLHPSQAVEANAYVSLIKAILEGKQERFVDTVSLLLSWEVWSPLLNEMKLSKGVLNLHTYSPDMLGGLNFELKGSQMLPMANGVTVIDNTDSNIFYNVGSVTGNITSFWSGLLGRRSVVSHKYALSSLVSKDMFIAAQDSVKLRGEFHLALPGGQSPVLLLNFLALDYSASFPWQQTHIWQTDERCVKTTSPDLNWMQISNILFSTVSIPFHHLHPMPITLQNGICNSDDGGDLLYRKAFNNFLHEDKLDYVVLGVGADGHIASIFPEVAIEATTMSNSFVMITELKHSHITRTKKRMTLSLDAILNARSIAVILTGAEKKGLLDKVEGCLKLKDFCDLPLVKLLKFASVDQLFLYIDSELI